MKYLTLIILVLSLISCSNNNDKSDAYGNFEADEVVISSETIGRISEIKLNEGDKVMPGQVIAIIDTAQLEFQKKQLLASISAVASRQQDISAQLNPLKARKEILINELGRLKKLFADGAATSKQLDDMNGEINVLNSNIEAVATNMKTVNSSLQHELQPLQEQLKAIQDKINKSIILSPIDGTILTKYVQNFEYASIGKPLFKVANLKEMYLRVYVSGSQLSQVKLGGEVDVMFDKDMKTNNKIRGKITWISDKAEFTPKIVQTKEERVNLVYAVKILVKNDDRIKIGMPGEIKF